MILPRVYNKRDRDMIKEKRRREGSPAFSVTITDLATTVSKLYGFEDDSDIRKFLPLNYIRLINKSSQTLKIYLNQTSVGEIILDDTIFEHYGPLYSFILENVGSGTATGSTTYTTVQLKPTGGS